VDVDDQRMAGGGQSAVDQVGHGRNVRPVVAGQECLVAGRVVVAKPLTVRGAGIHGRHPDVAHLLAFVRKAFGVQDQPGVTVFEHPRGVAGGDRGPAGDESGVGVRHVVEFGGQGIVVEQDAPTGGRG
jgi:hypothetical protein